MAPVSSSPNSVEDIFKDYSARRNAIIRALTIEADFFFELCDPALKATLCLYGYSNDSWNVTKPAELVPAEVPEPILGINFARPMMKREDWFSLVARHSDSWLLAVAFYYGARLNKNERKRLFSLTNDLPTVFEVVAGSNPGKGKAAMEIGSKRVKGKATMESGSKPVKGKATIESGSKSRNSSKRSSDGQIKSKSKLLDESNVDQSDNFCGNCGGSYGARSVDEFWIACDVCQRWFHGECVKVTPAMAESIGRYKCPSCGKRIMN